MRGRTPWLLIVCAAVLAALAAWLVGERLGGAPVADTRALAARAMAAHRAGRFDEAVALYRQALALRDEPDLHANLARALAARARFADAAAEFRLALAAAPGNGALWYDYGAILKAGLKDYPAAEEALYNATKFAPQLAEAQLDLGLVLIQRERYEDAIACLEAAVNLAPPRAAWLEEAQNALVLARLHARPAASEKPK